MNVMLLMSSGPVLYVIKLEKNKMKTKMNRYIYIYIYVYVYIYLLIPSEYLLGAGGLSLPSLTLAGNRDCLRHV